MNNNPVKANISRQELFESFENMDIKRFVRNVTTKDNSKIPEALYTWTCKVYCICRIPDDGRKMVKCTKCKSWYHCECVLGYFSSEDWRCPNCEGPKKNAPLAKQLHMTMVMLQAMSPSLIQPNRVTLQTEGMQIVQQINRMETR